MMPLGPAPFSVKSLGDVRGIHMPGLPRQDSLGYDFTGRPAALEPVGSQI